MNKIIIHGRVTRKPELKTVGSGSEVCRFTVAVNRPVSKDKEQITDFFDVDAWGKSGVFVEKYFDAGDGIIVEGAMQSRKFEDKDGNKRVAWSVHADRVEFAEKRDGKNSSAPTGFAEVTDEGMPF